MDTNGANGLHSHNGSYSHNGHNGANDFDASRPAKPIPVIEISDITKVYQMGDTQVRALDGVSLTVCEGEYVAIIGASGSGKSTLMNMIGLLDRPTSGSYRIRGVEVSELGEGRMADLRNREIGFIFGLYPALRATWLDPLDSLRYE